MQKTRGISKQTLLMWRSELGNVLSTVSDRKRAVAGAGGIIAYWQPELRTATDYYPFGMQMPGRSFASNAYRWGFQGQEEDRETGWVNYKYRIHDPRTGRFFAVDPLAGEYPSLSTYHFSHNSPLGTIELEGMEGVDIRYRIREAQRNAPKLGISSDEYLSITSSRKIGRENMDFIIKNQKQFSAKLNLSFGVQGGGEVELAGVKVGVYGNLGSMSLIEASVTAENVKFEDFDYRVSSIANSDIVKIDQGVSASMGIFKFEAERNFDGYLDGSGLANDIQNYDIGVGVAHIKNEKVLGTDRETTSIGIQFKYRVAMGVGLEFEVSFDAINNSEGNNDSE